MIRIIHGDSVGQSRKYLQSIKDEAAARGNEVITITGKGVGLDDIKQAVEAGGLFGAEKLVVIEELFTGQVSKGKSAVIEYLKSGSPDSVVIWEAKRIDGRKISKIKAEVKEFKVSSMVFKFLESVAPGRQQQFVPLLEEVLKVEAVELVFFLLVRQVRQLIGVASDAGSFRGPPWLASKLKSQADTFGLDGLLLFHETLYRLEIETKTGSGVLPLRARLELALLEL